MRRLLALMLCAALLELGWLALWPLSLTLSHSPLFSASVLQSHPEIARWMQTASLTETLGAPSYIAPATQLSGLMLYLAAMYFVALLLLDRGVSRPRATLAVILAGALVFQMTLLCLPGLFSQDVFSYIAYGRLSVQYDLNPYIWPPSVVRDAVVPWVADVWRTYTSPYGPLWVDVQWLIGRVAGDLSFADQALVYRGLASVLLLVNLALAWRLLGRLTPLSPTQRTVGLAALAWNPLVLFEIAANAHNDVLMVTFTLLALMVFRQSGRGTLSTTALALGTLVKYLSGIGLIWVGLATAARGATRTGRLVRLAGLALLGFAVAALVWGPWLELPDSLDPLLNETARVGYVNSLPDTLMLMAVYTIGAGGLVDLARGLERGLILVGFAAYLVWETRQVWCEPNRASVARALARSSLVYVLLVSTSVQTWYFCLPVCVAVVLGWRRRIARLSLAYAALALPALYLSYYLRDLTPGWVFVVYAFAPLLVLLPSLRPALDPVLLGRLLYRPATVGRPYPFHGIRRGYPRQNRHARQDGASPPVAADAGDFHPVA